ncbi:MAG: hypothetical protein ACOX48_02870 [Limnochordia bacterium]
MYQYWAESQAAQYPVEESQFAYGDPHRRPPHHQPRPHCPHLPGTVLRVSIPPGAVINLANLLEVVSPSGICLIVRIPAVCGGLKLNSLVEAVQKAGGTVEFQ